MVEGRTFRLDSPSRRMLFISLMISSSRAIFGGVEDVRPLCGSLLSSLWRFLDPPLSQRGLRFLLSRVELLIPPVSIMPLSTSLQLMASQLLHRLLWIVAI